MNRFVSEVDRDFVNAASKARVALGRDLLRFAVAGVRFAEAVRRGGKGKAVRPLEVRLEREMGRAFRAQGTGYVDSFSEEWWAAESTPLKTEDGGRKTEKTELGEGDAGARRAPLRESAQYPEGWEGVDEEVWDLFEGPLVRTAAEGLKAGARGLMAEVGVRIGFDLKNPRAVKYITAHGAELVKGIMETTREDMRVMLSWGMEHGWSYDKMAGAIQERFKGYYDGESWWNFDAARPQGHIDSRAHLISVTEAGEAYEEGGYEAAGMLEAEGVGIEKMWSTMGDDAVSEGCKENEDEGWIGYEETHRSGDLHPLRFPGCRCDEIYRRAE